MKITIEFDTTNDNFDHNEMQMYLQAPKMASCLFEIQNKIKGWYKHDERNSIPTEEISDSINEIIFDNVDMQDMGY